MLFHFANAPLLPLVGQKLALQYYCSRFSQHCSRFSQDYLHSARFRRGDRAILMRQTSNAIQPARQNGYR
jgi:hypothetical protein